MAGTAGVRARANLEQPASRPPASLAAARWLNQGQQVRPAGHHPTGGRRRAPWRRV